MDLHIVGLGASAGGLEALERFFEKMPPDSGMAFVVIQHLSPDFKSHMSDLLARKTKMAIHLAEEGMVVQPNCIYLIPARKEMVISEGKLLLKERGGQLSHPIDQFFRSLANDTGRYSIAVILSGTGSDGSRGIRDISAADGLVLCQNEESAKFDGMPLNAQATGVVDLVLPPESMAEVLTQYVSGGVGREELAAREVMANSTGIERIFESLREYTGLDFTHYKASTIGRRVKRRMDLDHVQTVDEYYKRLQEEPEELSALYADLLIGVTRFFRDQTAFDILRDQVIPELFASVPEDAQLRIWIAGCATGEEAYSLAILLEEHLRKTQSKQTYKLFATDAYRASLEHAALGNYTEDAVAGINPEYLERYFRQRKSYYKIVRELRQKIVFAPHNVLNDPPFTNADLVCCRNLLIYFQSGAQRKTLSLFHFALKTGGILFLGPGETPGDLLDEFQIVDKRWRIYRKRRDIRLPLHAQFQVGSTREVNRLFSGKREIPAGKDRALTGTFERLLAESMGPSILVDDSYELIHVFGGAERFISHRSGRHSSNLLDVIDPDLKMPVAGGLLHALKDNKEVVHAGIQTTAGGIDEALKISIKPIHDRTSRMLTLLVRFDSMRPTAVPSERLDSESEVVDMSVVSKERIEALESDLRFTRENLQATIEELETANEELQATNEEMIASNEELQSTNEELQSVNEELYTVNVEHQKRIEELAQANNDMDNLLAATQVGVIFVDDELAIRRFTPEIGRIFHLMPQDIGKPIDSFNTALGYKDLVKDVRETLTMANGVEREIVDRSGTPYLLRLAPYRDHMGVTGVVVTLIDISAHREAKEAIEQFKHMSEVASDVHVIIDSEGRLLYSNPSLAKLTGKSQEELGKIGIADIDPKLDVQRYGEISLRTRSGDAPPYETEIQGPTIKVTIEFHFSGIEIGGKWVVFAAGRDITDRKAAEHEAAEARQAAEAANEAKSEFLANMSHEIRTPLTAVLGFAEMIERDTGSEQNESRAQIIRQNGKHLLSIINDILDLSKIEAKKMDIELQEINIASVVNDVSNMMAGRATKKGVDFEVIYQSKIPEVVATDPIRLRQILINLCGNALKFTDEGSVELSISYDNSLLEFRVVDTGIGISQEGLVNLFQPFTQDEHTNTGHVGGTGLGLTISKRLAGMLGGDITVDSQVGVGSTFRLVIPVKVPASTRLDTPEIETTDEKTDRRPLPSIVGKRILVADDRRDVWRVAQHFLEQAGATVVIASDGQEAVDIVVQSEATQFDAVLMDMQMPIKTGYEAVIEIRNLGYRMPIIALTAGAMKGERERCLEAGCDDYLTKPVDGVRLVEAIARLVARSEVEEASNDT